ncbi:MAG: hypothetical protein ACFFC7_13355 [Candidatus Hermodarchaeota archaeon]
MVNISNEKLVSLPYSIACELLESKIRSLNLQIEQILKKWNQVDIETFQEATKRGELPEAETDAIIVGNLSAKLVEYEKLYQNL